MVKQNSAENERAISRDRLADLLNEDLSREYQAIIGYVVYSQVLKGAAYMNIANQLEIHAKQELDHALIISRQIDYLGKMPVVDQGVGGSNPLSPTNVFNKIRPCVVGERELGCGY